MYRYMSVNKVTNQKSLWEACSAKPKQSISYHHSIVFVRLKPSNHLFALSKLYLKVEMYAAQINWSPHHHVLWFVICFNKPASMETGIFGQQLSSTATAVSRPNLATCCSTLSGCAPNANMIFPRSEEGEEVRVDRKLTEDEDSTRTTRVFMMKIK